MTEDPGVDCLTFDNQLFYSAEHPCRAVHQVLFGFAMYERPSPSATEGFRIGLTDQHGASEWLRGIPLSEINHFSVPDD